MTKPSKDHPWRKTVTPEQYNWAIQQSKVSNPNNIVAADLKNAKRKPKDKRGAW